MDAVCIDDIKTLLKRDPGAYVSIYMPTHHSGGADPQDPIRLKNLIRQAEEKLSENGMRSADARVLLEPVQRLIQDNLFWRQQSGGLAVFLHNNLYVYFKVPATLEELVAVNDRFHLKPLLPLLSGCGPFYVLALSQNDVRLLQCTEFSSTRLRLEGVPRNLAEYMQSEVPDSRMQYHSGSQEYGSNFGAGSAIQSGEIAKANYQKNNILQYFERINKGVFQLLKEEKAPLVLAGVEYLMPLYEKANSYNNLIREKITGNPEIWNDDVLRQQAWKIVQPYFDKTRLDAIGQFNASAGTGLTATDLKDVITAAHSGRVRFLFAAKGLPAWGTFNSESGQLALHPKPQPGDEDLIDLAAFETLSHAGTVYIMNKEEVPGNSSISAILRY
jgi:hypothetical protein